MVLWLSRLMRMNVRAELRRALFAGAETCWVYAILLTLSGLGGFPRNLSPFSIFIIYWAGIEIGHYLPRLRAHWRLLQAASIGLAALLILAVLRIDLYADV